MHGLLDAWEAGTFYNRFVDLAWSTNDSTAIFLATKLLSPTTSRYTMSARLGGGAFGVVHKIDVSHVDQSFALKVIKAVPLVLHVLTGVSPPAYCTVSPTPIPFTAWKHELVDFPHRVDQFA